MRAMNPDVAGCIAQYANDKLKLLVGAKNGIQVDITDSVCRHQDEVTVYDVFDFDVSQTVSK
jgi:hypothetical protein